MFSDNNFIEYIGINEIPLKYKNKKFTENFIEDVIDFSSDIDIIRVYLSLTNEEVSCDADDTNLGLIEIMVNIEYMDDSDFGEVKIQGFKYYKTILLEGFIDGCLHNFASYMNISTISKSKYYIYIGLKSFYL